MPRTKRKQSKSSEKDTLMKNIKDTRDNLKLKFETEKKNLLVTVDTLLKQNFLSFRTEELSKTPYQLQTETPKDWSKFTDLSSLHSLSCGDDEGYLTSGSVKTESQNRHRSRLLTRLKQTNKENKACVSRSKFSKPLKTSTFITPQNTIRPNKGICTITPKVNSMTPQVIMRRPKQGEVAVSMQGSPLMVSNIISNETANVNVPLAGGKIFTVQPFRGAMRRSQIPDLSPRTATQIQTLRDNLNQLCLMSKK